ncbi:MAG: hypothetical protein J4F36_11395 [Nitrosopumilaceae archaeon]|nr:hypothetical protein [Nitrosopumilaceae archaeon]
MANILKEKNNVKLLHRNSMSEDESSELHSTKVGHMKISYSDLEKMDERICQNCYHNYRDHVDESGTTIPCRSCKNENQCEDFRESV